MNKKFVNVQTLHKWLYDNYQRFIVDGNIDVNYLELELAKTFNGKPNNRLHEYVIEFCCAIQSASRIKQKLNI